MELDCPFAKTRLMFLVLLSSFAVTTTAAPSPGVQSGNWSSTTLPAPGVTIQGDKIRPILHDCNAQQQAMISEA
jgi:hypothetical protein